MEVDGRRVLYVTYDGLTDPLGRSQVLPYLAGLSKRGHDITILSFEKPDKFAQDEAGIRRICDEAGLRWHPLPYHKSPPVLSSVYDVAMMKRAARRLHKATPFDIVHCRSYIPAIVGLYLKRRYGMRFLFDMRGFWIDEKVEGGHWNLSRPIFRVVHDYLRRREAEFFSQADHVISLTHEGERVLRSGRVSSGQGITVIPCCVDFDHFRLPSAADKAAAREVLGIAPDRKVIGYLGSLGGNYMLAEMLAFFLAYRADVPNAILLFITRDDPGMILDAVRAHGIDPASVIVRPASRDEVPRLVAAADIGIAFKQPGFSASACSPTKLGEMLALGVPVVANAKVGDVAEILRDTRAGVVVETFDSGSYDQALSSLERLQLSPNDIRRNARRWFDVEEGVGRYDQVYRGLH